MAWACASIDVQNNRGEGGQNEIGPELFRDIGVLRTSELLAAHQIDGAEQYFTRAIDYGYSWDPNEVIQKWGRDEIVGDYVRLFRTLRPDVIVTMNIQGGGGDRAHEATTMLVREAFRAAGDPARYPEQLQRACGPGRRASCISPAEARAAGAAAAAAAAAAAPGGAARTRSHRHGRATTRCSRGPTPRSAPTRAAITSVRAPAAACRPCQAWAAAAGRPGRGPGGAVYTLVDTTIPGAMEKPEGNALRRRRSQPRRPREIRRGESARRADQRPRGHRRSRRSARSKPSMRATTPARPRRLRPG